MQPRSTRRQLAARMGRLGVTIGDVRSGAPVEDLGHVGQALIRRYWPTRASVKWRELKRSTKIKDFGDRGRGRGGAGVGDLGAPAKRTQINLLTTMADQDAYASFLQQAGWEELPSRMVQWAFVADGERNAPAQRIT